ncbi:hypothetical protein J6590_047527 [Homalodisca vitripennis]|nr:hypothetical protein J6590_047527 [Homalodisca vitripennis]
MPGKLLEVFRGNIRNSLIPILYNKALAEAFMDSIMPASITECNEICIPIVTNSITETERISQLFSMRELKIILASKNKDTSPDSNKYSSDGLRPLTLSSCLAKILNRDIKPD